MSRTIISSLCAENNLEGTLLTKEEVEEISNSYFTARFKGRFPSN